MVMSLSNQVFLAICCCREGREHVMNPSHDVRCLFFNSMRDLKP